MTLGMQMKIGLNIVDKMKTKKGMTGRAIVWLLIIIVFLILGSLAIFKLIRNAG